jgi:N-acetylglucosamine-6-sulfatase
MALGLCLPLAAAGCGAEDRASDERPFDPRSPNLLVVMTDDQTAESFPRAMPRTRRLLVARGTSFTRSFATYPLCCPSRATFFTGQLAHNNGVLGNKADEDGGGYANLEEPDRVLPVWLREGGYATAHVGKFVHGYDGDGPPPGWDLFWGFEDEQGNYFDYALRGPGAGTTQYGDTARDYATSVITRIAERQVRKLAPEPRPFFLSIGYSAPHTGEGRAKDAAGPCGERVGKGVAQPAPRDLDSVDSVPAGARPPSFNEANVSDKPESIRKRAPLRAGEIRQIELRRACADAALAEVDRGMAQLLAAVREAGELRRTIVLFTSDNGLFFGEHRIPGDKNRPYEEAIRVPLVVAGPGIERQVTDTPAANVDLAPTLLDLAGVRPDEDSTRTPDGVSLAPVLRGGAGLDRRAIPIAGRSPGTRTRAGGFVVRSYQGVRTPRYLFVRYFEEQVASVADGLDVPPGAGEVVATELYDLKRDPFELENLHGLGPDGLERRLRRIAGPLAGCEGRECVVSGAR